MSPTIALWTSEDIVATQPNLDIFRLQGFYEQIKKAVGPHYPLCIAGGAVRDILCKKPVKDLDIFVQVSDWEEDPEAAEEEIAHVVEQLNMLFFSKGYSKSEISVAKRTGASYGNSHIEIAEVWAWKSGFNDMAVDVVFICHEPSIAVTDGFDFGICQAWVGFYGLKTTPAFWKDYNNKTLTYMFNRHKDNEKQYKSSQEHLVRLLEKFPGWHPRDITIPD